MNLATAAAISAMLGLSLGIPLGRRIERVAWHADATIARARVTAWMIRDLTGWLLAAAVIVAIAVVAIWSLLNR